MIEHVSPGLVWTCVLKKTESRRLIHPMRSFNACSLYGIWEIHYEHEPKGKVAYENPLALRSWLWVVCIFLLRRGYANIRRRDSLISREIEYSNSPNHWYQPCCPLEQTDSCNSELKADTQSPKQNQATAQLPWKSAANCKGATGDCATGTPNNMTRCLNEQCALFFG